MPSCIVAWSDGILMMVADRVIENNKAKIVKVFILPPTKTKSSPKKCVNFSYLI